MIFVGATILAGGALVATAGLISSYSRGKAELAFLKEPIYLTASNSPEVSKPLAHLKIDNDMLRDAGIVVLAGTTGLIHLNLGTPLFFINGVGFIGLAGALYLVPEDYRPLVRDTLIAYTAVTFVGYFALKGLAVGLTDGTGLLTKLVELGLFALLWLDRDADLKLLPSPMPLANKPTPFIIEGDKK